MTETAAIPLELNVQVERYVVYRCFSGDGQLLYIGETGDLGTRLAAHAKKLWFTQVRGITLEWHADELGALNAERRAIHVEHPKYNKQHRHSETIRKPRSAPGRGAGRTRKPRPRNTEQARAEALAILSREPGISGAQLADRVGKSERWGQMVKKELASHVAGADDGGNTTTEE